MLAKRGINLVGLNVDADPKADVGGFLKENPVNYPILVGGVPLSIVVDERGIVTELIPGWSATTRARFDALAGQSAKATSATPNLKATPRETGSTPRR